MKQVHHTHMKTEFCNHTCPGSKYDPWDDEVEFSWKSGEPSFMCLKLHPEHALACNRDMGHLGDHVWGDGNELVSWSQGSEQQESDEPVDLSGARDGTVGEVIDGRVNVYGDPVDVFPRQALAWSAILGIEVTPWQVALCMMSYKLVRTAVTPDYSDNSDDVEGYLDIFRTIIGEDMVEARDTAAYLAGGGQGAR